MKQQKQEEKASQKASKEAARVLLKLEKERVRTGKEGSRTPSMEWSASRPLAMRRHAPSSHAEKPSIGIAVAMLLVLLTDISLAPWAEEPGESLRGAYLGTSHRVLKCTGNPVLVGRAGSLLALEHRAQKADSLSGIPLEQVGEW